MTCSLLTPTEGIHHLEPPTQEIPHQQQQQPWYLTQERFKMTCPCLKCHQTLHLVHKWAASSGMHRTLSTGDAAVLPVNHSKANPCYDESMTHKQTPPLLLLNLNTVSPHQKCTPGALAKPTEIQKSPRAHPDSGHSSNQEE